MANPANLVHLQSSCYTTVMQILFFFDEPSWLSCWRRLYDSGFASPDHSLVKIRRDLDDRCWREHLRRLSPPLTPKWCRANQLVQASVPPPQIRLWGKKTTPAPRSLIEPAMWRHPPDDYLPIGALAVVAKTNATVSPKDTVPSM